MSDEVLIANRYALLSRLGVGGMGEVWRADDRLTNQTVAIKVLRPSIAGAPAAELRFQREIQAMVRLNHPRVVPIIDAGADRRVGLFFVMALQRGRPLHEAGKNWSDWRQMWPVVDQVLETLAHAHAHAVIHRDIKPDNILIDQYGEAILLDFGVARLKDQARSGTSAYDMLGTVDYAAPEQATGSRRRIGPWTDLYCFGIVLYEIICGRLPFWASSPVQSLMIRLDHSCPPLDPRPGFVTPRGLWEVLDRMMQPEPFERFRHAADARAAFAALVDGPYETLTAGIEQAIDFEEEEPRESYTDEEGADLLATRQARYAQAADGNPVARPLEAPLRTTTLVGRDNLLLQLSRGLDRWRQNPQPGVLVLSGERGSGKTRLSLELTSPFMAQGDIDGHRHHWRVGPSMRETALSITGAIGLGADQTRDHLDWWLQGQKVSDAPRRKKAIEWMLGQLEHLPTDDQGRLFADFMRATTRERPFVLTLDGLEVIDDQVLALVYAVRAHRLPVIVLITAVRPATGENLPTPGWLKAANRTLAPLDEEALFRIVDELVELPYDHKVTLVREARGNPKTLLGRLYRMRRLGEIIPAWPRWRQAPPSWAPPEEADVDRSLVMASSIITDADGEPV
jgi:serine/threonine protein kinase